MSRIKKIVLGVGVVAALGGAAVTWHGAEDHSLTPVSQPRPDVSKIDSQAPASAHPEPAALPPPVTEPSEPVLPLSRSTPPPPSEKRIQSIASLAAPQPQTETETVRARGPSRYDPPPAAAQPVRRRPDRRLQDPFARVALAFVGADYGAEAYWVEAIFDPMLSDEERDDLMEDLNEVGFSNGKYPGPGDRPLIENRIAIVEDLLPVVDDFMFEHLAEAHKDLVNMLYGEMPK